MTTPHPERGLTRADPARTSALAGVFLILLVAANTRRALAADEIHWTVIGQTSVSFNWRGSSAEDFIVYGTHPWNQLHFGFAYTPSPTPDSSPGPFWEARLTGLLENTVYSYWIGDGPEYTFRTPPPRGSSDFWFAEQADVGSTLTWPNVGIQQAMIADDNPNIPGDDRPRFVLVAGDLTYGDQNEVADVDQHFNDVMVWSTDAAYMPAWGNHEWGDVGAAEPDDLNNYEGRFDLPNSKTTPASSVAVGNGPGEDWYWFDYGNTRFISFPEPFDGTWTQWAIDVDPIMAEAQLDPDISFIITYGHRPTYSSGSDHSGETELAGHMAALHASHSKYVLSLHAHSHHYERTNPALTGGIVFVIGSGGGSSLGGMRAVRPAWTAFRMNYLVHLRFHVLQDRIEGYAICGPPASGASGPCPLGTVIDQFTVLRSVVDVPAGPAPGRGLRVIAESNPARGVVALRVESDAAGEQSVEVHDTAGRLVRLLPGGFRDGGTRSVLWDGLDAGGRAAPAGLYRVTARAGGRTAETRVALLR